MRKIVQAASGNIKSIVKVFKFNQVGARGPAGTISSISTLPEKAVVVPADLAVVGDSAASFANKKSTWQQIIDSVLSVFLKISNIQSTIATLLITALNYQAPHTSLTPANGATATVDVSTKYDYTITPSGALFTLDLDGIPAAGIAWSVTTYAINWDGVTVIMPAGSVTPDNGAGLSFTSGGGKDRIVARGNAGPSGEKEFYNLPGNMG